MPALFAILLFATASTAAWILSIGGTSKADSQGHVIEANFRTTWIDDADLERVATLSDLRTLDLSHTRITDIGFRGLKPLTVVEDLNLYYAEQVGDGALNIVRNWKHLKFRDSTVRNLCVSYIQLFQFVQTRKCIDARVGDRCRPHTRVSPLHSIKVELTESCYQTKGIQPCVRDLVASDGKFP